MLAPASFAEVLSGILAEEREALAQARAAVHHHRSPLPPITGADNVTLAEQSQNLMISRYSTLAEVHRRRVRVLEDLLALDVGMPQAPAEGWAGDNVIRLESRR